ncbi:MAG TPA: VOC family protein [Terriglobales bacterium]|jgi:catechol 2,3-dioxygenase-like lactoylglutathione lyase family enzyme|nr:VOC family protein [Terriglobales bacterium]
MILGIDHLVIVVKDLAQATADYERLGFTLFPGGQHPVGSHNSLISFHDGSYLEIIAFYREAVDHRWWDPLSKGERLVDFCFQTDDLRDDTRKLREAGVAINDPVPWSRKRPDGYELKWLLSLATGSHRGVAPFLIEDMTPRAERVPQECAHKNGIAGIEKVIIAVGELAPIEKWYRALLGSESQKITDEALGAEGLAFHAGPHVLEFLAPRTAASPLVNWLRVFGPSPYSAVLNAGGSGIDQLDPALTHGAHLFVK